MHFLLSCNIGEILVLLITPSFWNAAAAPAGADTLDKPRYRRSASHRSCDGKNEPGAMKRPPRDKSEGIVTQALLAIMLVQGAFMALCTLGVYTAELYWLGATHAKAQTMAFTTLCPSARSSTSTTAEA